MPASKISDLNGWDEFKDPAVVDWKSVRRLIEHEDQLVNQRITWLLSSQSFLLLLIGAMMGFMGNVCAAKEEWKQFCYVLAGDLLLLPPLIGLVTSSFAAITISQAERQSRVVTEWWHTHYPNSFYYNPPAFPRRPDKNHLFACWFRYSMLASIFAAAWAGLILAMVHTQWTSSALITAKPGIVLFFVLQMVLAVPYVYLAFGFGEADFKQSPNSLKRDVRLDQDALAAELRVKGKSFQHMRSSRALKLGLCFSLLFLVISRLHPSLRSLSLPSVFIVLGMVAVSMLAYRIGHSQHIADYLEKIKIIRYCNRLRDRPPAAPSAFLTPAP